MKNIWKTLREEHPKNYEVVFILTKNNKLKEAFWCEEHKKFYPTIGLVKPIIYKRWCAEDDLINEILQNIK